MREEILEKILEILAKQQEELLEAVNSQNKSLKSQLSALETAIEAIKNIPQPVFNQKDIDLTPVVNAIASIPKQEKPESTKEYLSKLIREIQLLSSKVGKIKTNVEVKPVVKTKQQKINLQPVIDKLDEILNKETPQGRVVAYGGGGGKSAFKNSDGTDAKALVDSDGTQNVNVLNTPTVTIGNTPTVDIGNKRKYAIQVAVDSGDTNITYVGEALPGTATSGALWRIQSINETSGTVVTWADGDSNFDNIWDNREGLSYS